MTLSTLIERMRTREADLAESSVVLTRRTGAGTLGADASYTAPPVATIYSGAGQVRPEVDSVVESGETSVAVSRYKVKLPADTPAEVGDNVRVISSTFDAGLAGMTLRVVEVLESEWQVTRKLRCEVETGRPT